MLGLKQSWILASVTIMMVAHAAPTPGHLRDPAVVARGAEAENTVDHKSGVIHSTRDEDPLTGMPYFCNEIDPDTGVPHLVLCDNP
ncbi:uncharacterized protein RHO25_005670 [Cercospora beticola]|uniref:Uncharacterized protein n=1 Tax=Cercospora beticola TaxID=122368 RepID=A0ABZ0NNJ2_CERBT|nr:hypothetical protein RHO25_005670 [Cercospora beticola]